MKKLDYVFWTNIINKEEIKYINNICETKIDKSFSDLRTPPLAGEKSLIKTSKVNGIKWFYLKSSLFKIWENWMATNQECFGFDLYGALMEHNTYVHYNVYDSSNKGEYEEHIDATPAGASDIKLTAMVIISEEPYEGGKFCMFTDGKMRGIDGFDGLGSSIIFKSWIPHKVTPVTKGVRKTLSVWLHGPRLR